MASMPPLTLRIEPSTAALEAGRQTLQKFLEDAGTGAGGRYRTELAFEELVVNVMRHGYRGGGTSGRPIDVRVGVRGEEIVLTIEDDADPFDPLQVPQAPRPGSIAQARIGGLGLQLVRSVAKQFDYERLDGRNRVTVAIGRH
jgi:anti-sigma regulatory factor (Ser/Thr protein kinase)